MRNFMILSDALGFIDENLCEPISQEDIARACFCSVSQLQKLFRYAFCFSVKEYIEKRRLTQAAKDIVNTNMTITDISAKYQYNSPEVFSRAFARIWNLNPSAFRKRQRNQGRTGQLPKRFSGLFPKITDFEYIGDSERGIIMSRKLDISEVYDVLKEQIGTYVLCFDIVGLLPINDISRGLGDKAILESLQRIESVADDNMLLFRIGSDEFALVTCLNEVGLVKELASKVIAKNGEVIHHKEFECPLSLRAGAFKMNSQILKYNELYSNMQEAINRTRDSGLEFLI